MDDKWFRLWLEAQGERLGRSLTDSPRLRMLFEDTHGAPLDANEGAELDLLSRIAEGQQAILVAIAEHSRLITEALRSIEGAVMADVSLVKGAGGEKRAVRVRQ